MRVVHFTPTYFDGASVIGGGERYPTELALWTSKVFNTTLVSFSSKRTSFKYDNLKIEIYPIKSLLQGNKVNAFNFSCLSLVLKADVVHIHNVHALASVISVFFASILIKRCFVTDYGGGSGLGDILNQKLSTLSFYKGAIAYSRFGQDHLPPQLRDKAVLIKGGIDVDRYTPDPILKLTNTILYVGRILPHKGINYLVEGFRLLNRPEYTLKIIGRVYSDRFYQDLKQLSQGLSVEFIHDADDQRLLWEYRSALVTVLPSVHHTCYGNYTPVPELMGFTLLESQACGTPVVCTDAGAMHEFVDHGRTGFVVQQNSGEAIAAALRQILNFSPQERQEYQKNCLSWVQQFSWQAVVEKHIALYRDKYPSKS